MEIDDTLLRRLVAGVDGIAWITSRIETALLEASGGETSRKRPRRVRWPDPVAFVKMERSGSGVRVSIDGAGFKLPRTLADLLLVLCLDQAESPDGLAGFKEFSEIAKFMTRRLGRPFKRHTVAQVIHRLRNKLESAGLDRYLVEVHRKAGARFRVRSQQST